MMIRTGLALAALAGLLTTTARGAEPHEVELFAAMQAGDIEVKFVPKDAAEANLIVRNVSERPLRIQLPAAFGSAPVLAQQGFGQQGFGQGGGQQQGGGNFGGQGFGNQGGFMDVGPDKVMKRKAVTVCLEHGKEDPNPRVPYTIVPIESITDKPEVVELCKMVGRTVDQRTAQAAAWHLANDKSWQELAGMDRVRLSNGYTEKWFSPQQLNLAGQVVAEAKRRAEESPQTSPGEALQAASN